MYSEVININLSVFAHFLFPAIYPLIRLSSPPTSNTNISFCVLSWTERNISLISLCKCGKHRLKIGRLDISKNKVDFFANVHLSAHSAVGSTECYGYVTEISVRRFFFLGHITQNSVKHFFSNVSSNQTERARPR